MMIKNANATSSNVILMKKANRHWSSIDSPIFTIITPTYDRGNIIIRTLKSVQNQTFKNFEYIIVDDGSRDNTEEVITDFMNKVDFPVLYIKKKNGGVHTARNVGIKNGRGQYVIMIDSDDELVEDALKTSYDEWNKIPQKDKANYYQIKLLCKDENGHIVGDLFEAGINEQNWRKRKEYPPGSHRGEHIGVRTLSILKENLWPEPHGITFVSEHVIWGRLNKEYESRYVNEVIRVYHTDNSDHLSDINKLQPRKYTLQNLKNVLWNSAYFLDHKDIYIDSPLHYIKEIVFFSIFKNFSKQQYKYDGQELSNKTDRIMYTILYPISLLITTIYQHIKHITFVHS